VLESARLLGVDGSEIVVPAGELAFGYRDSRLKHGSPDGPRELVVEAAFQLAPADPDTIKARLDEIRRWRQAHQPIGLPSAGSVFRNPPGDSAGRLIEEAGLKGLRIGGAVVSEKHANFIVNDQKGTARDVRQLAERIQSDVASRHGIRLEFEIEFAGDWPSGEVAT
jgi:UDP-N-acetylmuramate dehydrogenase